MPSNLTTVAQTLLEKIKDTNVANHQPSEKRTTQLNYESTGVLMNLDKTY